MRLITSVLEQLSSTALSPRCECCGAVTMVDSEDMLEGFPPAFAIYYRCPSCGVLDRRYRVYDFGS